MRVSDHAQSRPRPTAPIVPRARAAGRPNSTVLC